MPTLPPVRLIVTGHDDDGNAVILSDGPITRTLERNPFGENLENKGLMFHEIWETGQVPVPLDRRTLAPTDSEIPGKVAKGGTKVRIIDYPRRDRVTILNSAPLLNYLIVLQGQAYHRQGQEKETLIKTGDIVVNRGSAVSIWNRFDETCRIAYVIVDGEYVDDLAGHEPWSIRVPEQMQAIAEAAAKGAA